MKQKGRSDSSGESGGADDVLRALGVPDLWFGRFRRELCGSGDASPVQAILAIRNVAHRVEEALGAWLTPHGLSLGQFNVLITLWGADGLARPMSDIGRALVTSPANATKLVAQLEAAGLIRREDDPGDRRGVLARLTPEGERRIEEIAPGQVARVEEAMRAIPAWGCGALIDLLGGVREGFDRAAADGRDIPARPSMDQRPPRTGSKP